MPCVSPGVRVGSHSSCIVRWRTDTLSIDAHPALMRINLCARCQRTLNSLPSMKLFSNTRSKRTTASVALLVWLFASASGIANACVLEAHGESPAVASTGSSDSTHAVAVPARHAEPGPGHDEDSDNSKAPCLKACDDGLKSLLSQKSGNDLNDPGVALVVAVLWPEPTRVLPEGGRVFELRSPSSGPPVRTRYPRLTI